MRVSAAISVLILAVAALIGWREHGVLSVLRVERERLSAEAAAMGVSAADEADHAAQRTRRERADKLAVAGKTAQDILALARELNRLRESGDPTSVAMQDRILEALENLGSLNTDQLKVLFGAFQDAEGLDDGTRRLLLTLTIHSLSNRNPEVALGLLAGSGNPIPDRSALILSSLSKWTETDPDAALAWVRAHPLDSFEKGRMEAALVQGAARTDLRMAFGMIRELGLADAGGAVLKISRELAKPEQRAELLRLMKGQPGLFGQKEINTVLVDMGKHVGKNGFEEGARWIKENGFNEEEIRNLVAGGMVSQAKAADTGRWVEWMGENLSGESRERYIGEQVKNWTAKDHRAAGEWLAALPDGSAKAPAVAAFARTVAEYDPQIAAQWALTMPPGEKREETLKEIYERWPQDDAAAKAAREAFAREHKIE